MKMFDYQLSVYKEICAWPAEWALDVRHAKLLHNLLMHAPVTEYAEIGCYAGVSTTAAVQALIRGKRCSVHLCDLTFTPPLLSLVHPWLSSARLHLHTVPSHSFLRDNRHIEFVFLDGDHSLKTVKKELNCLMQTDIRYIAAHDTSALERALAHGMPESHFSGPAYLRETLQCTPGWHCLEERRRRKNEATVRGFFFATKDLSFYRKAQFMFSYWANIPYTKEYFCRYDPNFAKKRRSK